MLSDEQKEQIKAEEIFRVEVSKSLAHEAEKSSQLWTILNSNFVLFLLSGVFLAFISGGLRHVHLMP
jgi:hypothetical protein